MIRVLEVIRQGEIGGGESHVIDLVTHFDRSRVCPIVLAMSDGPMITRLRAEGIECIVVPSGRAFDLSINKTLKQIVREKDIQIIHAHGSRAASNMLLVARSMHLPLIYTVHGWSFHDGQNPLVYRLRAWSEKLICRWSKRVICVSESNAQTGRETFGLKEVTVIENGVDTQRFSPDAEHDDLRKALGVTESAIVVAFIARMTLQKNPLLYLQAMQLAHEANNRVEGLMVGNGDLDNQVADYISQNNMASYIHRSPFRTDVSNLLHTADIYCLPSKWEGLSIALLEAMSMALPVVVTPTDGTSETIVDQVNGVITPFDDASQLAENILSLADDASLRERMGREGRNSVAQRFNARRVSDAVTEIYYQTKQSL